MQWTQTTASWPIAAPPAAVYDALTSSDRLCQWFAEHADVDAHVGGNFHFWGRHTPGVPSQSDSAQKITVLTPNQQLGFSWHVLGVDSTVMLSIAPHAQGATLTVQHAFANAPDMERPRAFVDDFWRLSFANLIMHLSGMSGLTRPDFSDPAPVIQQSLVIDAPKGVVFEVLINPELINVWSGSTRAAVDVQAGVYQLGWQYEHEGRQVNGGPTRILNMVADSYLKLDWPDWRGDESVTGQRIVFALSDAESRTRVDFTHSGFARAADLSDYGFGWIHFLSEISRVALEAHRS